MSDVVWRELERRVRLGDQTARLELTRESIRFGRGVLLFVWSETEPAGVPTIRVDFVRATRDEDRTYTVYAVAVVGVSDLIQTLDCLRSAQRRVDVFDFSTMRSISGVSPARKTPVKSMEFSRCVGRTA